MKLPHDLVASSICLHNYTIECVCFSVQNDFILFCTQALRAKINRNNNLGQNILSLCTVLETKSAFRMHSQAARFFLRETCCLANCDTLEWNGNLKHPPT